MKIRCPLVLRNRKGWKGIVSLVALPVRHAGVKMFGVEGSGYTTKAAMAGLYARSSPGTNTGPAQSRLTSPEA